MSTLDETLMFSEFEDEPDEFEILERAGKKLWRSRRRWIHSLDALRAEPVLTSTVDHLRATAHDPAEVVRWIRRLYKHTPFGPDCPATAIALDLLPPLASDQSLRSALLPLLGLKGARFNVDAYRVGELRPGEDDGPTLPLSLDDVIVPAVALRVVEALQDLRAPALADVLRWLNGYWVQDEGVRKQLARLVESLASAGDTPAWRTGTGITPVWALQALAADCPTARGGLNELGEKVRRIEDERRMSSGEGRAAGAQTYVRRLTESGGTTELTPTQSETRDRIVSALVAEPPRSVLLVGASGSGRSVVAAAVGEAITTLGSAVYVGSPMDVSAGAVYTNELDGRIKAVVDEIAQDGGVWVLTECDRAATIGRHSDSSSNFADRIAPAIVSNRLRLVAEVTEAGYAGLLRESPRFADVCDVIHLPALPPSELRQVAEATLASCAAMQGAMPPALDESVFNLSLDACRNFLSHLAPPAAVARLAKRLAAECAADNSSRVEPSHVYAAVAAMTGYPAGLIDPTATLDLAELQSRLSSQVLGQPDAVGALVERIAMVKAGLCSRERPNGVFLFVGPTGTGKTELARSLAGELFGDHERLIRVDMSELDWHAGTYRLLGGDRDRGPSLADEVRAQPFSVVLLDEFEKADPRIWDIFLPIFDTGLLTDQFGRTVDFGQTIVIATSNLGASVAMRGSVGFSGARDTFDESSLTDAVRKALRPELLNRFDRIISFRPLTRDVMRKIVRVEVGRLFRRHGLRHLGWRVEVDESAIDFILERAFTSDQGARPARRAVERLVATPLAVELASGGGSPDGTGVVLLGTEGEDLSFRFRPSESGSESSEVASVRGEFEQLSLDRAHSPARRGSRTG